MTTEETVPKQIAYVAGPMRNYDQFNFPAFDECSKWLRWQGWDVRSPAEHDRETGFDETLNSLDGFDIKAAFAWDCEQVITADIMVLLPGWEHSTGVAAEMAVAKIVGTDICVYDPAAALGARLSYWQPPTTPAAAESVAEEAHRLVHGERQGAYGHPADDFTRTGKLWGAILGCDPIAPELVGLCMATVKISREVNSHKRDNLTDLAGYAATIDLVHQRYTEESS